MAMIAQKTFTVRRAPKDGKPSYTHIRYSDDGGQTFTAASQRASDEALESWPLDVRNLVDVKTFQGVTVMSQNNNGFRATIGVHSTLFRMRALMPWADASWEEKPYVISGFVKASGYIEMLPNFGDVYSNNGTGWLKPTSNYTYFEFTFPRTKYIDAQYKGFLDFDVRGHTSDTVVDFLFFTVGVGQRASAFSKQNILGIDKAPGMTTLYGRNHLVNSDFARQTIGMQIDWNPNGHPDFSYLTSGLPDGMRSGLGINAKAINEGVFCNRTNLVNGETYTLSLWAKGDGMSLVFGCERAANRTVTLTGEWQRFEITFVPSTRNRTVIIYSMSVGNMALTGVKLELGSAATPWTPAPEDTTFGTTEGAYMGVAVSDKPYPPLTVDSYTWSETKGEPAYTLDLSPSQLVFDTAEDGIVTPASLTANTCTVRVARGGELLTPSTVTVGNNVHCKATHKGNGVVAISSIDIDSATKMSYGAGYVDVTAKADGKTFTGRLYWGVNLHKVTAKIITDNRYLALMVQGVSEDVDGYKEATNSRLKVAEDGISSLVSKTDSQGTQLSQIQQRADSISLTVSNMRAGVRGMLTGGNLRMTFSGYGFANVLKTHVERGKTYTMTVAGYASPEAVAAGQRLAVYIYAPDWSWSRAVEISSTTHEVKSLTFVADAAGIPADGTLYVNGYSYPNKGADGKPVTLEWVTVTEGAMPAAEYIPSSEEDASAQVAKLEDTVLAIKNRRIVATSDNFEVRNNKGERTMRVTEDGQLTVGSLVMDDPDLPVRIEVGNAGGVPYLYGVDWRGMVVWRLGGEFLSATNNGIKFAIQSPAWGVWHSEVKDGGIVRWVYKVKVTVTNNSNSPMQFAPGEIKAFVTGTPHQSKALVYNTAFSLAVGQSTNVTLTLDASTTLSPQEQVADIEGVEFFATVYYDGAERDSGKILGSSDLSRLDRIYF